MEEDKFNFLTEQFDDIKILRYQVPAFGQLPLREKIFVYYLSQAALAGRDILWDQNNRYNLRIRKILERIVREYPGGTGELLKKAGFSREMNDYVLYR